MAKAGKVSDQSWSNKWSVVRKYLRAARDVVFLYIKNRLLTFHQSATASVRYLIRILRRKVRKFKGRLNDSAVMRAVRFGFGEADK